MAGLPLLGLAMLLWGAAAAQTGPPPAGALAGAKSAVEDCGNRNPGAQPGLTGMEQRCPDLSGALQAARIRPLIIDSSRTRFDDNSLHQLAKLIHPATGPAPSVAALGPVLRALQATPQMPRSWWGRLMDWLIAHLAPKQQSDNSSHWLAGIVRMLAQLQWLWTAIIWGVLIALPIGTVLIVVREIRAMGGRSIDASPTTADVAAGRVELTLALLRQTPLGQRPARLFAMLISRLVAAGRLPPDRSLTHREVARRALLDDAEHRRLIESLARLSERQLYSGVASTPPGLDELLARGEDLYVTGWGRPMVS